MAKGLPFVCCLAALSAFAAERPVLSFKTDRGIYPEPALPQLPQAGGTFVDPTFGTTLMRVTDEADGKHCHNAYSYYPSFNRDSTRLHAQCGARPRRDAFVLRVPMLDEKQEGAKEL